MSQQNVSEDLQQSVRDAEPAKPASTPSPVASENAEVITLEPLQKPRSTGKATKYHQLNQPQPDNDTSPLAPPAAVSKITPISTASDKLAEINERVSRILAPVHALEALRSSPSSMNNGFSTFQANINTTPQPLGLQVPNLDPMPARTGNQRGRGSRRRGNDIASGAITFASNVPGTLLTPPNYSSRGRDGMHGRGSGTGRGRGAARGGKRRRSEDDSGKTSDTDASENFTPLTQSRSGRKIIHTAPSTPIIKIEDNDAKASPLAAKGNGSANGKGSGKKRGGYRRTPGGASAVCKNCGRGHSPLANTIVFCDGCNTPWHQFCHDPPIGKDIVTIAEKEWFCSDCIVMKEERVRLQGKVAGQNLSMLEKRRYLQSLPSKELVSLLLHACLLHPDLPVFNQASNGADGAGAADEYYEDEDLLPYPKAGNGVPLRPEKERLNILLDDDTEVFSHTTIGIAEMVAAATGISFAPQVNGRAIRLAA